MFKSTLKILSLATALAVTSLAAHADTVHGSISIGGGDTYTTSSIHFTRAGDAYAEDATGTFADLFTSTNTHASVTMNDFNFGSGFVNPTQVFTLTNNGKTVTFSLTGITSSGIDSNGDLHILGVGTFTETGYSSSTGTFNLTSQNGSGGAKVTFSASAVAPTPEPNTLLLLGTGLMSSAGALYRRRRKA
ncbi:MAG: PEP-CTERM sorting domain-containing protein [Acidobacteria bacterium]|nr:PEP-CTERM sorting domain-containing protein [Acidobacteriota bacterium]